jgi:capsular exopolysaccharide synthesis family protein
MSKFFDAANQAAPSVIELVKGPLASPPASGGGEDQPGGDASTLEEAGAATTAAHEPDSLAATALDLEPPRRVEFSGARTVSVCLSADEPLLPFDGSHEAAAERYRIIRTRIVQHPKQPRVICISSSGAGDGKTVNAINIAGALALKQDVRVLLVDCDFRKSAIESRLGIPRSPGMSDVLAEHVDWASAVVRVAEAPNLYIIPAGEPTMAPPELLESSRWLATVAELQEVFDYVVIDSPPIGIIADFDLIQAACDSVILIVRQDHTERGALLKAIDAVPKEKMLGVIMNSQDGWLARRTYSLYGAYGAGKKAQKKQEGNEP